MSPASDDKTPASEDLTAETGTQDAAGAESAWADEVGAAEGGAAEGGAAGDVASAQEGAAKKAPAKKAPAKADKADDDKAEADKAEADKAEADKAKSDKAKSDKAKADKTRAEAAKAAKAKADARASARAEQAKSAAKAVRDSAELPAGIFDAQVNIPLIHQVVVAQQAAARQGTHAVKTRGDVRGGGRKPYRQKGTGRARQGSTRAPQFAGGGIVHGPVPRSYVQKTPKKMKVAALRGALSDRARHGFVKVVSHFTEGEVPRTQDALAVLTAAAGNVTAGRELLVVAERKDQVTWKSLRNVAGVHLIDPGQLNTYDVLVSEQVVFTESALASFVARTGSVSQHGAGQHGAGQEGDEQ